MNHEKKNATLHAVIVIDEHSANGDREMPRCADIRSCEVGISCYALNRLVVLRLQAANE